MHGIACGAVANSHCEELVSKSLCCVVGVEYGLRIIHMIYIIVEYDVWTDIAVAECVVWLG
jgi:hypothetical protein